jgi:hypothetical protein
MANKNVKLKTPTGDYVFPVTPLANITISLGTAIEISGNTIGCKVAVAGTTATSQAGVIKPNSTHFTVDANGFMTPKTATTSALGVAKFSSTYFTVSSGSVTPKAASATAKGVVELATVDEAKAGTDTERAVTPAGLAAAIADAGTGGASELNGLSDVQNSNVLMNPYSNPTDFFILVYNPTTKKWQPSNWLQRFISHLGSDINSIGTPFDQNDIT